MEENIETIKKKIKSREYIEIENIIKNNIDTDMYAIIDIECIPGNVIVYLYKYKGNLDAFELGKINKKVYNQLEKLSYLKDGFCLEISSPGIYRKIKNIDEFNIFKGRSVKILTTENKQYCGLSMGVDNNLLKLIIENSNEITIKICEIKKANLN